MQNLGLKSKIFKFLLLLLTFAFLLLTLPTTAYAHILKTDGPIGAVLHIDPGDDPIIGEPALFFFEFKDKEGRFSLEKCSCKLSIIADGQEVFSDNLKQTEVDSETSSSNIAYTFAEKGIYTIQVTGEPNQPGNFENFNLTYDLRVERTSRNLTLFGNSFLDENFHLIALGFILLIFVAVSLLGRRKVTKETNLKNSGLSCFLLLLAFILLFQYGHLHQLVPTHQHQIHTNSENNQPACCSPSIAFLATNTASLSPIPYHEEKISISSPGLNHQDFEEPNPRSPPT